MYTIPDPVLAKIARQHPQLVVLIADLRQATEDETVAQLERTISSSALAGNTGKLSGMEVWNLAQCAAGGPYRGGWWTTTRAAIESGYDASHLARLIRAGSLRAVKRGKTWYVARAELASYAAAASVADAVARAADAAASEDSESDAAAAAASAAERT